MNILFDLDGTLTDPRAGIVGSIQYALAKLGQPVPAESELLRFIGPPLRDSFRELLTKTTKAAVDQASGCVVTGLRPVVDQALGFYRERYSAVGLFENHVYPGIPEALKALCGRGDTLFVATSKPGIFAERIVQHFHLADYFRRIWGSELDGVRSDKTSLIAHILQQEKLSPSDTVMVGDRSHDAVGARANGIVPVGVLWGYGDEQELTAAQCKQLLRTPADLANVAI